MRRRCGAVAPAVADCLGARLESLEPRLLLSGDFFDTRTDLLGDLRFGDAIEVNFEQDDVHQSFFPGDDIHGTQVGPAATPAVLSNAALGLEVIDPSDLAGVLNLSPTSGAQVVSPGGGVDLIDDNLQITFPTPVQAFGIDILFDGVFLATGGDVSVELFDLNSVLLDARTLTGNQSASIFTGYASNTADISEVRIADLEVTTPRNLAYDSLVTSRGPPGFTATIVWDGSSDGDGDNTSWNDPDNWDLGRVPGAADAVLLDVADDPTVEITTGVSINSIVSEELIRLSGGSLVLAAESQIRILDWTAGTLNAGPATVRFNGATYTFSGATAGAGAGTFLHPGHRPGDRCKSGCTPGRRGS